MDSSENNGKARQGKKDMWRVQERSRANFPRIDRERTEWEEKVAKVHA